MHTTADSPFGCKIVVNADYTASGEPYQPIEKFMENVVYPHYANTHSNAYNGKMMANLIDQSRSIIRKCINAKPCDKIIFTGDGTSGAIIHLIHMLNLRIPTSPKTVVFVSVAEHHSNYLPWTHLPIQLDIVPITDNGIIDLDYLETKLRYCHAHGNPIVCSFIACSNVTGVIQPTYDIAKLVHKWSGLVCFDFATSAPYVEIDMHHDDTGLYDAIFISPHKFLGGPGAPGLLVASQHLFRNKEPFCPGGGTVRFVSKEFRHYSTDVEVRESGGTPNILGSIKTGLVFQLKEDIFEFIKYREHQINTHVFDTIQKIPNLQLVDGHGHQQNTHKLPIYSFQVKGLHYNFVVVLLNDLFGIQSRGGVSCCSVFAQHLLHIGKQRQKEIYEQIVVKNAGVPNSYGWCRITFHYTMTMDVVDYILKAITFVCIYGHLYQKHYMYSPKSNTWCFKNFEQKYPILDYTNSDYDHHECQDMTLEEQLLRAVDTLELI